MSMTWSLHSWDTSICFTLYSHWQILIHNRKWPDFDLKISDSIYAAIWCFCFVYQIFKGNRKKWRNPSKMLPKRVRGMFVWFWQRRWFSQNEPSQSSTPPKPTSTRWRSAWRISFVSCASQFNFISIVIVTATRIYCQFFFFVVVFLIALLRVAGSVQKSTEVMKAMQNLIKVPEIQATMRELSKEMMKVCSHIY